MASKNTQSKLETVNRSIEVKLTQLASELEELFKSSVEYCVEQAESKISQQLPLQELAGINTVFA